MYTLAGAILLRHQLPLPTATVGLYLCQASQAQKLDLRQIRGLTQNTGSLQETLSCHGHGPAGYGVDSLWPEHTTKTPILQVGKANCPGGQLKGVQRSSKFPRALPWTCQKDQAT